MNRFRLADTHPYLLILVVLLPAALGCRTYGGYGTEEKTLQQIDEANRLFADELARAQGYFAALSRSAQIDQRVDSYARQYEAILAMHDVLLAEHRSLAAEAAENSDDYRLLNRALGMIVTDQRIISDRYAEFLLNFRKMIDAAAIVPGGVPPEGRYVSVPPFYTRLLQANTVLTPASLLQYEGASDQGSSAEGDSLDAARSPEDRIPVREDE